jgi:hypothetical protein
MTRMASAAPARACLALGLAEFLTVDGIAKISGILAPHHQRRGAPRQPRVDEAADASPHMPSGQFRGVWPPIGYIPLCHGSTIEH